MCRSAHVSMILSWPRTGDSSLPLPPAASSLSAPGPWNSGLLPDPSTLSVSPHSSPSPLASSGPHSACSCQPAGMPHLQPCARALPMYMCIQGFACLYSSPMQLSHVISTSPHHTFSRPHSLRSLLAYSGQDSAPNDKAAGMLCFRGFS